MPHSVKLSHSQYSAVQAILGELQDARGLLAEFRDNNNSATSSQDPLDAAFEAAYEEEMKWGTREDTESDLFRAKAALFPLQQECADLRAQIGPLENECVALRGQADHLERAVNRLRTERDHLRVLVQQATEVVLQSSKKEAPDTQSPSTSAVRGLVGQVDTLQQQLRAKDQQLQELEVSCSSIMACFYSQSHLQEQQRNRQSPNRDLDWMPQERAQWESKEKAFHASRLALLVVHSGETGSE
jgi:chromosome segregation ATPase